MNRVSFALAILALAILACAVPVGNPLPTHSPPTATALAIPTPTPTKMPTEAPDTSAEVTAFEALHVRAAPDPQAEVLDYLYVGEDVSLTGKCSDGWAQIEWKGSTAWVNSKFLSRNKCSEE